MAYPNKQDAILEIQSVPMSADLVSLADAVNSNAVVSGCAVTAQGSPDMTVAVAAGLVSVNGTISKVTSGNVTITAAHATLHRIDAVVVDSSGVKSVTTGTAAAEPDEPEIPANSLRLARIDVPAVATAINAVGSNDGKGKIIDKRVFVRAFGTIGRIVTDVTVSNTVTETNLISITIPANLLGTTKMLRIELYGTYTNDTGATKTITFRAKFGGTTQIGDVSGSIAASANRYPFKMVYLVGMKNATNAQTHHMEFQIGGAQVGSVAGAGDLAAAGIREAIFHNGNTDSTVDTTADVVAAITIVHSAASASLSMVVKYGIVRLE